RTIYYKKPGKVSEKVGEAPGFFVGIESVLSLYWRKNRRNRAVITGTYSPRPCEYPFSLPFIGGKSANKG
ncbi:MAG: hypothetical protein ABS874_04840, partial [Lachnospiraceae bacterium]